MNKPFNHQSGIITGAAQGIGFTIAQKLLQQGANVLLNDHDEKVIAQAEKSLSPWKEQLLIYQADASQKKAVADMVTMAVEKFGSLDFAVANAGLTHSGPFLEFEEQPLREMMDLNFAGSFFLAQAVAKYLVGEKKGGSLLLMSSTTGVQAHRELEGYGMTKAALQMLARNLAPELGPYGITVNCVAPGATATPRTTDVPDYVSGWSRLIPSGKVAATDDIAAACLFLLSAQAKHINGQTLIIDGGWTTSSPLPDHV